MAKRKQNPATAGLSSAHIEGQGTTNKETGSYEADSSRKRKRGKDN